MECQLNWVKIPVLPHVAWSSTSRLVLAAEPRLIAGVRGRAFTK